MQGVLQKLRVLCCRTHRVQRQISTRWETGAVCATDFITSSGCTSFRAAREHSTSELLAFFDRRIHQHKYDSIEGFAKKYEVHRLVYYESYQDVHAAIAREKQVKRWRREKKIALIEKMNPRWQDLAESWAQEMRFRGQSLARTP
jgi:putative endonuclease